MTWFSQGIFAEKPKRASPKGFLPEAKRAFPQGLFGEKPKRALMEEKLFRKKIEELSKSKGKPHIIEDRCKGCGFCTEFCPTKVLIESKRFNATGYHPPEFVEAPPDRVCMACRFCEIVCPEFAICVEVFEEKEKEMGGEG